MNAADQRLLGRLAELSWFRANGEVAATRSLTMLLEHEVLRSALVNRLSKDTGLDLSATARFVAERVQSDGSRPDIEGLDAADRPLIVIEAKFGALLTVDQVRSYLRDQTRRFEETAHGRPVGVFTLLVPRSRLAEARLILEGAIQERQREGLTPYLCAPVAATWDQWLDLLAAAASSLPETPDGLTADLVQLRSMCLALGGVAIAPFGVAARGAAWRSREDEYRAVIDHATRELLGPVARVAPLDDEVDYLARRYFASGLRDATGRCGYASLGLATGLADADLTPVWLRFHRRTPGFTEILGRIMGSGLGDEARREHGHLWLPVRVDPSLEGSDLVADLVLQVETVRSSLAPLVPAVP